MAKQILNYYNTISILLYFRYPFPSTPNCQFKISKNCGLRMCMYNWRFEQLSYNVFQRLLIFANNFLLTRITIQNITTICVELYHDRFLSLYPIQNKSYGSQSRSCFFFRNTLYQSHPAQHTKYQIHPTFLGYGFILSLCCLDRTFR